MAAGGVPSAGGASAGACAADKRGSAVRTIIEARNAVAVRLMRVISGMGEAERAGLYTCGASRRPRAALKRKRMYADIR